MWSSLCGSGFSFRQNVRNSSRLQIISNWLILSSFHLAFSRWQFYRILNTNSKRFQHVCVQTEVCNFCILNQTEWQKFSFLTTSTIGHQTDSTTQSGLITSWLALVIWTLVMTHWIGRTLTQPIKQNLCHPPPKKIYPFSNVLQCFLGGVQKVLCMRFWTSEWCV